jgi:hypothetical protein
MVGNSSLGEWLEGCSIGLDALRLRALHRATSLSTKRRFIAVVLRDIKEYKLYMIPEF